MPIWLLKILDVAFFVFHTLLVLFNLFGWINKKTRRWQLATLLVTALSWFAMGLWKGIGYCICTDWHFQVRHALGYHDQSPTYIHLLVKLLTGANLDPKLVQTVTAIGFIFCVIASLAVNFADWRRSRHVESMQGGGNG